MLVLPPCGIQQQVQAPEQTRMPRCISVYNSKAIKRVCVCVLGVLAFLMRNLTLG